MVDLVEQTLTHQKIENETIEIPMKALLESGLHFGHKVERANPNMAPYFFAERNGIHIFDLKQTREGIKRAKHFVTEVVRGGGRILFVCTKTHAQSSIAEQAQSCGMPYLNMPYRSGRLRQIARQIGNLHAVLIIDVEQEGIAVHEAHELGCDDIVSSMPRRSLACHGQCPYLKKPMAGSN